MGAFTEVQRKAGGTAANAASLTVTLESTPAKGNLLVASVYSDNTGSMTSSGWALINSQVSTGGGYLYWKVAGESESKEVKWSPTSSASAAMAITEYHPAGGGTPKLDVFAGAIHAVGTIEVGPTSGTKETEELAVFMTGTHGTAVPTYGALSNSFSAIGTPIEGHSATTGQIVWLNNAIKELTAKEAVSVSQSVTGKATGNTSGILAVFYVEGTSGKAWKLELADTVTASDALVKGTRKAVVDSITGSDAVAKFTAKPVTDSVTAADSIAKLPSKALAESVTAADGLSKLSAKRLADSVGATDTVSKQPQKALADSVTASDFLGKRVTKAVADIAIAVDSLAKAPAKLLIDAVTASDSILARIIEKAIPLAERPTKLILEGNAVALRLEDHGATAVMLEERGQGLALDGQSGGLALNGSVSSLVLAGTSSQLVLDDQKVELELDG